MSRRVTLYTRANCCLCEAMKGAVREAAGEVPLELEEVDVDSDPKLARRYGEEVPVLFIDGRKAFKYRVTVGELQERLKRKSR